MNAQAILEKIGAESRQAAAALLKEAGEKAEAIRAASEMKITRMRDETIIKAKAEAEAMEDRMQRMAELEERKQLLYAKRKLMDKAFQMALDKFGQMSKEQLEALFLRLAVSSCKGTETLEIGLKNDGWFTPSFLKKLNTALEADGKPGQVKESNQRRKGVTGLILLEEGLEINCSLEALLLSRRMDMETEVASILYDQSH